MNSQRIILAVLCVVLCGHPCAQAQDMDTELSGLTEKLAAQITDHGKKKVTVLDFTDLQGASSEFGKYIAEELTVNLVMGKRQFSVLDRANLKSILAEHKLTATGLVDPENAKKLGQFAGVDALVIGSIIPKGQTISLTAKIITTDTAEIVGAGRADFKTNDTIQQLLSRPATDTPAVGSVGDLNTDVPKSVAPKAIKPFGDLSAKIESFTLSDNNVYGVARLTLIITNTNETETYGLAVDQDLYHNFSFHNSRSDWVEVTDVSGVEKGYSQGGNNFQGSFSDISPKSSLTISIQGRIAWNGTKTGDYRPYRLQTVVFFSTESQGLYHNVRKYNLIVDIK
jgi:TolB-like protein